MEEIAQVESGGDQPPVLKKLIAIADKYGLNIVGRLNGEAATVKKHPRSSAS